MKPYIPARQKPRTTSLHSGPQGLGFVAPRCRAVSGPWRSPNQWNLSRRFAQRRSIGAISVRQLPPFTSLNTHAAIQIPERCDLNGHQFSIPAVSSLEACTTPAL
jgi:hypothetical protein